MERIAWVGALLSLGGCSGLIMDPTGEEDGSPGERPAPVVCEEDTVVLGSTPMRRLTNAEYANTVRDLFGAALPDLPEQPDDAVAEGNFENQARALGPSDVRVARWEQAAMRLGRHAVTDPATRSHVLPCEPTAPAEEADCGEAFIRHFGRLVMRRPLGDDEVARYHGFFETQRAAIDFDAAVELTVAALLQSPSFLYRLELPGEAEGDALVELGGYEVASRLSYFLWESMPDDVLLAAAEAGELSSADALEAQARRMLADARARATVGSFHRQWLHLDRVRGEDKLPEVYPAWSGAVRDAAVEESRRFTEAVFFGEAGGEGTLRDLLTSNAAWVNADLAAMYGVAAPAEGWARSDLDPATRSGILSRTAFLAGHAHPKNGSPPLRGVFVIERFLCEPRPSPPADADTSPPDQPEGGGPYTNRQLFEQRTEPAACQGCHTRIDGFGFGFEHYDAAGLYRELDHGIAVDATGAVTGTDNDGAFDGAVELQQRLAESTEVHDCVTRQWFRYAWGRAPERADRCHVEALQEAFLASDGDLRELLVHIVTRPEFRLRPVIEEEAP